MKTLPESLSKDKGLLFLKREVKRKYQLVSIFTQEIELINKTNIQIILKIVSGYECGTKADFSHTTGTPG